MSRIYRISSLSSYTTSSTNINHVRRRHLSTTSTTMLTKEQVVSVVTRHGRMKRYCTPQQQCRIMSTTTNRTTTTMMMTIPRYLLPVSQPSSLSFSPLTLILQRSMIPVSQRYLSSSTSTTTNTSASSIDTLIHHMDGTNQHHHHHNNHNNHHHHTNTNNSYTNISSSSMIARNSTTKSSSSSSSSSSHRLDHIPMDLSQVVQRILLYLEMYHEDSFIRARYMKNLEHAIRFPMDGSSYHYPRLNTKNNNNENNIDIDSVSSNSVSSSIANTIINNSSGSTPTTTTTSSLDHIHPVNGTNHHHHNSSSSSMINGHHPHNETPTLNGTINITNTSLDHVTATMYNNDKIHHHTGILNGHEEGNDIILHENNGFSSNQNGMKDITLNGTSVNPMATTTTTTATAINIDDPITVSLSFEDSIMDLVSTSSYAAASSTTMAPTSTIVVPSSNNNDPDTNSTNSTSDDGIGMVRPSTSDTTTLKDWNHRILKGIRSSRDNIQDHPKELNSNIINHHHNDNNNSSTPTVNNLSSTMKTTTTSFDVLRTSTFNVTSSSVDQQQQQQDEQPLTFPKPLLNRINRINTAPPPPPPPPPPLKKEMSSPLTEPKQQKEEESLLTFPEPLLNRTNGIKNVAPPSPSLSPTLESQQLQPPMSQSVVTNEIAIYHALKNDYQPGGHVERIVTLPTKTEQKPFQNASMEALLAITSDQHDTLTTTQNDVEPYQSSTEAKLYSTILSNDFITTLYNKTNNQMSLNGNSAPDQFSSFDEIDGPKFEDFQSTTTTDKQILPPVRHEQSHPYSPPQQATPTELSYTSTIRPTTSVEDRSLQSWFQSDFLEKYGGAANHSISLEIPKETTTSLFQETDPDKSDVEQPILGWFKSDFIEGLQQNGERPMNGLSVSDTGSSEIPFDDSIVLEHTRMNSLTEAVVLLRSLTEDQWMCFDLGVDSNDAVDTSSKLGGLCVNGTLSTPSNDNVRIVDMLADILTTDIFHGGKQLSATEYNYSLARMALATDVAPDEILALLMQTHSQMSELAKAGFRESEPNSITHEILLLALVRRFSAFHNAIDLVASLSRDPQFQWSPKTLQAASELCERKDLLRMSRDLTGIIKTFDITRLKIPKRVFISLINVYKDNDARNDAIEMLKIGLKQSAGRSDQLLDEIFVHAIKWPYKNRLSGFVDNSSMLADIVSLLENETLYVAGFHVWKQLIYTSSFGATKIPTRYDFIAKAFRYLSVAEPMYHPDHQLLRQGLVACDVLTDSDLVWDLLRRAIVNYEPSRLNISSSDLHLKPHVPFQNFITGMNICLKEKNLNACEKILQVSKNIEMTPTNRRTLYILLLKGYANIGDSENTLKIIETMNAKHLNPGEECYGALFYSFAMSKQVDKARAMLTTMESGTSPVAPGPTCYDGFILACARCRAWEDILAAYEKMQLLQIPLSAATSHGVLLAAAKVGHRSKVLQYVESFITSQTQLHGDGAMLALRILLNGIVIGNNDTHDELTLDEIRDRLRILGQTQPALQGPCLNLIRSLRMAESEEARPIQSETAASHNDNDTHRRHSHQKKIIPAIPVTEIMDRRHVAWRNMLTDLLSLVHAIDNGLESSTNQEATKVDHI